MNQGSSFRRPRVAQRPRPRCRLEVELLEDRCLLSFSFKPLAFLGDTFPGGAIPGAGTGQFTFDFEPGGINNKGQVVFGADLSTGGEGTFFADAKGKITAMARTGDKSPDGATFGPVFLGALNLNNAGVSAIAFHRDGYNFPSLLENGSGLYRFDAPGRDLSVILLPGAGEPGNPGHVFHGYGFQPQINNLGTTTFKAIIDTTLGPGNPPDSPSGLGVGSFTIDASGVISKVARPGDPAPGGSVFDYASSGWSNDLGDVAFTGHVLEDPSIQFTASFPAGNQIFEAESVFLRDHVTGQITTIARQGENAPGGGKFDNAYGQKINNSGQIAYIGSLPAKPKGTGHLPLDDNSGVFFWTGNKNIAIARPGDAMPGGGHLVTAGFFTANVHLNNNGVVSFDAVIDTDKDGDSFQDTALYTWSQGVLTRAVGSGDTIPGLGLVRGLTVPDLLGQIPFPFGFAPMNDQGQILCNLTVQDGAGNLKGALVVATPEESLLAASPSRHHSGSLLGEPDSLAVPFLGGKQDSFFSTPNQNPAQTPVATWTIAAEEAGLQQASPALAAAQNSHVLDQVFADLFADVLAASPI